MTTDTSEKGLESLIVAAMTGQAEPVPCPADEVDEPPLPYEVPGWIQGLASDYNRDYTLDLAQLRGFLEATQPDVCSKLDLGSDTPTRRNLLNRLQGEVSKRGVIHVLRHGINHGPNRIDLFCGIPSPDNPKAIERFQQNRFSVTRQLRYSRDETRLALDLCLFVNGLPVATFELKNSLTKQTVDDAVEQYRRDRDPKDRLFEFGRCMVHFAVDDSEVRFCTRLRGKESWFLPFNKGWNDGAGNPLNPDGLRTDYLWRRTLSPRSLSNIIQNYAQIVEKKDERTGRKHSYQIFPRYHQLDVVRKLLHDAQDRGVGRRYLIQHSAGSGKSNSIAWLAHQLVGLRKNGREVFDSVVVVTDRRILDQQIRDTIRQSAEVKSTVVHAERSDDLRKFIEGGRKIIISTVQKFPMILETIGKDHRESRFAIVIDEAHSSQGGRISAAMSMALSAAGVEEDDETTEDRIIRIMETRKLLPNASYFAFTATPKNKTLEIFGEPMSPDPEGNVAHRPFHSYTMKQAIQEGFILDVLANYTPVDSYYRLVKRVEDDPEFDVKRARKKLRVYVESHEHAIRLKAGIMVDHFHEQVAGYGRVGGQARAMVVTSGIDRAIGYFHAIRECLEERKSPYRAIVAFSGEREYGGAKVTEASLNGFPSNAIADRFREEPYRFLVCADKFQTGYDEPLLHTMYVDKVLSGIKAVQTLSRLNRAHPQKHDTFVLDFMNDTKTIEESFADYYRTTILSRETDPDRLHDMKRELDDAPVYEQEQVERLVAMFLAAEPREKLDPILDACVGNYKVQLDEDGQVDFKGKAKAFLRTYAFLSAILPFVHAPWEELSIFLNLLVPKLPAPDEDDFSRGILETIDMDSYRVEKRAAIKLTLPDEDAAIDPVDIEGGGGKPEPEMERLSSIISQFNDLFGAIEWSDRDRVHRLITSDIPARVLADRAYSNARANSDRDNARIEHDLAINRVMTDVLKDDTELFRQFSNNDSFRRWLTDAVFSMTYDDSGGRQRFD